MNAKTKACVDVPELAATVQDLGITLEVVSDLYNIAVDVTKTDAEKASSLFTAIDRYMDDIRLCHGRLEACVEAARAGEKGGA